VSANPSALLYRQNDWLTARATRRIISGPELRQQKTGERHAKSSSTISETRGYVFTATASLAWPTAPAYGTNVIVDCSGANKTAFHSINDALNTLDLIGPHIITVSGVCHENVALTQRDRLTIQTGSERYATIQAANASLTTL